MKNKIKQPKEEIKEKIFQSIGEAAVCWKSIPTSLFDSTKAKSIGEELLKSLFKDYVVLKKDDFEHILACLANQKFINEVDADGLTGDYKKTQRENQKAIDKTYCQMEKILFEK